jgi:hypothetical protein
MSSRRPAPNRRGRPASHDLAPIGVTRLARVATELEPAAV